MYKVYNEIKAEYDGVKDKLKVTEARYHMLLLCIGSRPCSASFSASSPSFCSTTARTSHCKGSTAHANQQSRRYLLVIMLQLIEDNS